MYLVCMALFPPVAGYLLDATNDTATPLLFAGLLWLMIPVVLAIFKILQHQWMAK